MDSILRDAYSAEQFRESAHRIVDLLADHLAGSLAGEHRHSLPWLEPEQSLEHWSRIAEQRVSVEELCRQLIERSVRISDPKFMGHQICSPAPTAILAGFITDFLNNGSGVYEMGMAGTAMEKAVIRAVAERFGFPEGSDGFMTSGGTLANLTALLAARSVKDSTTDSWNTGTQEPLAILVSEQAHYCVDRAAKIMGWGEAGVIHVPTNQNFQMDVSQLAETLAAAESRGRKVISVVGSACTTSTGSFDDLQAIGEFCRDKDLWFHVDGAHGGAIAFSGKHRHLLRGIELADSVSIDFHKMLMTPVLTSAVVFRRKLDSFRAFSVEADYLFSKNSEGAGELDEYNLAKRTFECTKTMMSTKIFSVLAVHGPELLEANIDHLHEQTQRLAEMLEEHEQFQLAVQPQTNIVCFRYCVGPESMWSELNLWIREQLVREGKHYIVKTTLRGDAWLRCTIANPFSTEREMSDLLDAIVRIGSERVVESAVPR